MPSTNARLFSFTNKFNLWQASDAPEYYLHMEEINRFFRDHNLQITFLNNQIEALQKKYFVIEGDEIVVQNNQPVFIDGTKVGEYRKEFAEIMNKPCNICFAGRHL